MCRDSEIVINPNYADGQGRVPFVCAQHLCWSVGAFPITRAPCERRAIVH
jgi:hypothetical protein